MIPKLVFDWKLPPFNERFSILAIDPGTTTGFVLCKCLPERLTIYAWETVYSPKDIMQDLNNVAASLCIIEHYIPRNPKSTEIDAIKVIGIVELWAQDNTDIVFQIPQFQVQISNELIHANSLWVKGQRNARSAMKHLLWYLIHKKNQTEWLEVMPRD